MQGLRALLLARNPPALSRSALAIRHSHDTISTAAPTMSDASLPRQVFPPADLTPANIKFIDLPSQADLDAEMPLIKKGSLPKGPDPFRLVEGDLQPLSEYVPASVKSNNTFNPVLTNAASTFFSEKADKRLRPTIVALLGRVLSNGSVADDHLQLAQVTEMIHVATVIHDEVFETDEAEGSYGTKVAGKVLAGDYLLARASVLIAKLQHSQVLELMAHALDSRGQGLLAQLEQSKDLQDYLQKNYLKTASLIASSCRSVALITGYDPEHKLTEEAERFGYHFGMTYQIADDISGFKQRKVLPNLATACMLYASEVEPSLEPFLQRNFTQDGDAQKAFKLAKATNCLERSYQLAEFHAQKGLEALQHFPDGESKDALALLMHRALSHTI